ncbi:Panacea domain-containing protein [Olsenella phocaeensis]|uniref:Panacea domain-containing protein n=1 Tax=Olsenella phocaeensis TaxID=1852385 RepID=UPI0009314C98|nr:type II toxin-antitoxin system antitoxin SocA domain-containing protein [Olsenella phocaeensis]
MRALDIANALIVRHGTEDYLTNMKLNKLVYFAYADALRRGVKLFAEGVEAWPYGPVIPSVYRAFQTNGGRAVLCPESMTIPMDAAMAADETWERYGALTAIDLMSFSHRAGGAWGSSYDRDGAHSLITDADILASRDGVETPTGSPTLTDAIGRVGSDWAGALEILADK